jgi:hypothetical protein
VLVPPVVIHVFEFELAFFKLLHNFRWRFVYSNCNEFVSSEGLSFLVLFKQVYTVGVSGNQLVVGTALRKVLVWDLRNMGYVQQKRESSLKYQTRCIRTFPNKQGYVLSSIEGKMGYQYLMAVGLSSIEGKMGYQYLMAVGLSIFSTIL